ncbi:RNA polymerase sigma factor [Tundrisphaera lichenicola]|uniref:RNA polymerase sigma factor n=1 Tax=Tundrisphaera lichenicola TaxID=2029860 RepID=UPI003EB6F190
MASRGYGPVIRQVVRLFEGPGTAAGLGDGPLLRRFADHRDGAAFEALVARHGSMVLATCRRMLVDPRDVEDAFQATFLVLARKAGSIRDADRLGPWLHGVARRVASRSRALSARRETRERPGAEDRAITRPDSVEAFELRSALDEELARLPEKYRAPLVLCYLEGLTHDEAALQLSWPVGTVRSRLAGGRDRLRSRLTRRGLSPSAAVPAILPRSTIPEALMSTTIRIVTSAGTTPARIAILAKGALIAMMWNKLKVIGAVGLMAGLTVGGAGVAAQKVGQGPSAVLPPSPNAEADEKRLETLIKEVDAADVAIPAAENLVEELRKNREARLREIAALKAKLGLKPGPNPGPIAIPKSVAKATDPTPALVNGPPSPENRGGQSLLSNGGVEEAEGHRPSSWTSGADIPGVEYLWSRDVGHSGQASLCLKKTAQRYFPIAQWSQIIDRKGETSRLKVSAWVKAEKVGKAILDTQFLDGDGKWSHAWVAYIGAKEADDLPVSHDWKRYEGVVEIPWGTTQIRVAPQIYGPGTVWFDDLEAQYSDAPVTDPISSASASASPTPASSIPIVENLHGNPSLLMVIPRKMGRVTMINSKTGEKETFRLPGEVSQVSRMSAENLVAFSMKGRGINRVAIYDRKAWRWSEQDLGVEATEASPKIFGGGHAGNLPMVGFTVKAPEIPQLVLFDGPNQSWVVKDLPEPAQDGVSPIMAGTTATYILGKSVYVYNSELKKWSVLALKAERPAREDSDSETIEANGRIVIPDADVIHLYHPETGEWSQVDTEDGK